MIYKLRLFLTTVNVTNVTIAMSPSASCISAVRTYVGFGVDIEVVEHNCAE